MIKAILSLNLSQKLILFFCIIITIFCTITLIQFKSSTDDIKSARMDNVQNYTIQLNKAIAAQFFERYGDVQAFAQNEVFLGSDKKQMTEILNSYVNLYQIYNLILFIDIEGRIIASNGIAPDKSKINISPLQKVNFKNESWFINSINQKYTKDLKKGFDGTVIVPLIKDELINEVYKQDVNATLFAAPVKDHNGRIIGVLCNRTHSKWFENEITILKDQLLATNWKLARIKVVNSEAQLASTIIGSQEDLENNKNLHISAVKLQDNKFIDELGWSSVIEVPKEAIYNDVLTSEKRFYFTLFFILLISITLSYFLAKKINHDLSAISDKIAQMADYTAQLTHEFSRSSQDLSKNSVSQVTSIQQSVAALSQMTSMIAQTSEKVKYSNDLSQTVESKALSGQHIMEKVIHSMDEIRSTNLELQEINKTMNQISLKTELINDIVFKTQLLSFNASIEAARAGQNGRGFSVVADEVAHLAELSGKASKEIESLLNESKRKVEASLINIQSKISDGTQITLEANQTFNDITQNIQSINQQLKLVTEASRQQNTGIQQANSAMKELEVSADANSHTATTFNERFEELKDKTVSLNQTTVDLKKIVNG